MGRQTRRDYARLGTGSGVRCLPRNGSNSGRQTSVRGSTGSRLRTAVNSSWCRQRNGVGSLKSCKTSKEDLRRETYRTAVGRDRGSDRRAVGRGGGREPAGVAVGARQA